MVATARSAAPFQSIAVCEARWVSGSTNQPMTTASAASGACTMKMPRHPITSTSGPPTTSPITGAPAETSDHHPIALAALSGRERVQDHRHRRGSGRGTADGTDDTQRDERRRAPCQRGARGRDREAAEPEEVDPAVPADVAELAEQRHRKRDRQERAGDHEREHRRGRSEVVGNLRDRNRQDRHREARGEQTGEHRRVGGATGCDRRRVAASTPFSGGRATTGATRRLDSSPTTSTTMSGSRSSASGLRSASCASGDRGTSLIGAPTPASTRRVQQHWVQQHGVHPHRLRTRPSGLPSVARAGTHEGRAPRGAVGKPLHRSSAVRVQGWRHGRRTASHRAPPLDPGLPCASHDHPELRIPQRSSLSIPRRPACAWTRA